MMVHEPPNLVAGVAAGRMPEFIEMMQAGSRHRSGSTRGSLGHLTTWNLYEQHRFLVWHLSRLVSC
jgi:hypothetical protein